MMTVDELRRGIESIPQDEYFALGYYERWLRSIATLMVEKGVIRQEDLA
jgi:nitrile hydratase